MSGNAAWELRLPPPEALEYSCGSSSQSRAEILLGERYWERATAEALPESLTELHRTSSVGFVWWAETMHLQNQFIERA